MEFETLNIIALIIGIIAGIISIISFCNKEDNKLSEITNLINIYSKWEWNLSNKSKSQICRKINNLIDEEIVQNKPKWKKFIFKILKFLSLILGSIDFFCIVILLSQQQFGFNIYIPFIVYLIIFIFVYKISKNELS